VCRHGTKKRKKPNLTEKQGRKTTGRTPLVQELDSRVASLFNWGFTYDLYKKLDKNIYDFYPYSIFFHNTVCTRFAIR
jgi:hypothetical protein